MKTKLLKKIVTVSKYVFFGTVLQCILFTSMLAGEIKAQKSIQEIYVSVQGEDLSIMEVFSKIEAGTEFSFAYRRGIIDRNARVAYSGNEETSLADVLKTLSQHTGLKFRRVNDVIHVSKASEQIEPILEVVQEPEQTITITGTVLASDGSGDALPGVNVVVKGTSQGTVTDIQGKYSLEVPASGTVLVFSSVGYISEEVEVGNRSVIDITLTADVTALDEIVVVGFGTMKKSDIVGSSASANLEAFQEAPNVNLLQSLQGSVPGVSIGQTSRPGQENSIEIRGQATLGGNTAPLIVVDGMIFSGRFSDINPSDVASVEVLKDASSRAIYGSLAANGVILVTTKPGAKGKPTFN